MPIITCPNCKSPLIPSAKSMRCENSHCFDIAKQGYVNLILANKKKKSNPGDNKEMVDAREAFLSSGHYDILIEGVESLVDSLDIFTTSTDDTYLLDIGCGSGYYTRNLFIDKAIHKVGLDISKVAVAKAAVMDKASTYIAGSAFDLPIADISVDTILNIFSPIDLGELTRVLKADGYFIKVIPASDHMKEVAAIVYETVNPHQSSIHADIELIPSLEIVKVESLKKVISLKEQELHDFITMTPYLYKFKPGQLEMLMEMDVTVSFDIIIAKKIDAQ